MRLRKRLCGGVLLPKAGAVDRKCVQTVLANVVREIVVASAYSRDIPLLGDPDLMKVSCLKEAI
jgi:hypothetical protein